MPLHWGGQTLGSASEILKDLFRREPDKTELEDLVKQGNENLLRELITIIDAQRASEVLPVPDNAQPRSTYASASTQTDQPTLPVKIKRKPVVKLPSPYRDSFAQTDGIDTTATVANATDGSNADVVQRRPTPPSPETKAESYSTPSAPLSNSSGIAAACEPEPLRQRERNPSLLASDRQVTIPVIQSQSRSASQDRGDNPSLGRNSPQAQEMSENRTPSPARLATPCKKDRPQHHLSAKAPSTATDAATRSNPHILITPFDGSKAHAKREEVGRGWPADKTDDNDELGPETVKSCAFTFFSPRLYEGSSYVFTNENKAHGSNHRGATTA